MNDQGLFHALDRLVPDCSVEPTDWSDVLRRGGVFRHRRRAVLAAAAVVLFGGVLIVTPAFGVRGLLFGRGTAPPDNDYTPGKFVPTSTKRPAEVLLRRVLAGLGPRSSVKSARFGPAPARFHVHPKDALWLYVSAPDAELPLRGPTPSAARRLRAMLAEWEAGLVAGGLWDELYLHGTRPLAGCTILHTVVDSTCFFAPVSPEGQRFANPPLDKYRDVLRQAGAKDHFSVVSIHYLHPLQDAPVIVLRADRTEFTRLWEEPGPRDTLGLGVSSVPFEGWFLEVRDSHGPFLFAWATFRGESAGGYSNSTEKPPYVH